MLGDVRPPVCCTDAVDWVILRPLLVTVDADIDAVHVPVDAESATEEQDERKCRTICSKPVLLGAPPLLVLWGIAKPFEFKLASSSKKVWALYT